MPEIAPTPAEATAVTIWMVAVLVAPLGLTAGIALLHRSRGPAAVTPVRRRAGGLWTFALLGIGMIALGGQVEFLQTGENREITLLEVHGTGAPVYWLGYSLGAGLLTILVLALLPRRHTLRIVLGVPALVTGALLMGLLLMIYARIDQLDARHMAGLLAGAKPTGELSVPGETWLVGAGWLLGFVGTFLLLLVAAQIVADRYALLVLGAVAVAAALAATPATPDLSTFWVVRNNELERVGYSPFELGGPALLWPVALILPAVLLCAIPFLPRWWRGAATVVAALAPVWIVLATQVSYAHAKAVLPAMMRADGITVSKERAVFLTYLAMFLALGLLPVAAVRLWRAARRGMPLPWAASPLPPPTAVPSPAAANPLPAAAGPLHPAANPLHAAAGPLHAAAALSSTAAGPWPAAASPSPAAASPWPAAAGPLHAAAGPPPVAAAPSLAPVPVAASGSASAPGPVPAPGPVHASAAPMGVPAAAVPGVAVAPSPPFSASTAPPVPPMTVSGPPLPPPSAASASASGSGSGSGSASASASASASSSPPGKIAERLGRSSALTRAAAVVTLVLGAGLLGAFVWLLGIGITDGPLAGYILFGAVPFLFGMLLVTAAPRLWRGSSAAAARAAAIVKIPFSLFVGGVATVVFMDSEYRIPFLIYFSAAAAVLGAILVLLNVAKAQLQR